MKEGVFFIAGLALGIVGMIFFPGETEEVEHVKIEPPVQSTRKIRSGSPRARVVDLEKWREGRLTEKKGRIENADREELQALVTALIKQGNPYAGLNLSDKTLIKSALAQLMKGDAKGTVAWLQAAFQEATSDRLAVVGIKEFLETDWEQALELTLGSPDPRLHQDLASSFLGHGCRLGADQALRALSLMPDVSVDGRSGSGARFADNFDFAQFGEGTIALVQSRVHQDSLITFPSNFLTEWAKKDREAATSFYLEHLSGKSPRERIIAFNDLEDLIEGVFETANVEEGASWVGEFLDGPFQDQIERRDLVTGVAGLKEGKRRQVMKRLLERENGPAAKLETLELLFGSMNRTYSRETDAFRIELLGLIPDASSRLDLLTEAGSRNKSSLSKITAKLRDLGHSEEEIERVVSASIE